MRKKIFGLLLICVLTGFTGCKNNEAAAVEETSEAVTNEDKGSNAYRMDNTKKSNHKAIDTVGNNEDTAEMKRLQELLEKINEKTNE